VIRGIGCDLIEIERFRTAISRSGTPLLTRLFTPTEIAYCSRNKDPVFCFAGRFAAKEALAKALGVGIGSAISWHDMEIVNDEHGKPYVLWRVDIQERFGVTQTHISISHSHTVAIAYAVLET
jgi:holo-[acyl-carrier protein] synthase